jgi:hypothetical protein
MIKQMTKKVKERKEYFIDFTDEECKEFRYPRKPKIHHENA